MYLWCARSFAAEWIKAIDVLINCRYAFRDVTLAHEEAFPRNILPTL